MKTIKEEILNKMRRGYPDRYSLDYYRQINKQVRKAINLTIKDVVKLIDEHGIFSLWCLIYYLLGPFH